MKLFGTHTGAFMQVLTLARVDAAYDPIRHGSMDVSPVRSLRPDRHGFS